MSIPGGHYAAAARPESWSTSSQFALLFATHPRLGDLGHMAIGATGATTATGTTATGGTAGVATATDAPSGIAAGATTTATIGVRGATRIVAATTCRLIIRPTGTGATGASRSAYSWTRCSTASVTGSAIPGSIACRRRPTGRSGCATITMSSWWTSTPARSST